jgi:membrane-bound lytic murein transglycosylase D
MKHAAIDNYLKLALLLMLAGIIFCSEARSEPDPFPMFSSIQPNVSFWKKIYSKYSSDQGIIHDKRNLSIIYGVIELKNPDLPGGRKANRKRIKKAKKKYKTILAKLMQNKSPYGEEAQRIAALFGPDAKPSDYQSAMRNIRCQVGQKDRFRMGIIRSGAYIAEIRQIFREAELPEELAFLPHVESSFNTKAYSKFGAAGIWQFTRSTGRKYMRVGYTVDERRDPILSSHAAAKMLRRDYQKFNSWPVAITAYNHGASGMLRALRKHGNYEKIFNHYRSRTFRFASRNFYSEFIAARAVAKNYQLYFGNLKLDKPQKNTAVLLTGYVSFLDIAQYLNIDTDLLSRLNPALRQPVIRGQKYIPKGYRLRLPFESGQDWETRIANYSKEIYHKHQKRSRIYTVVRGDTAGEIAKSHGIRLSDLIAANNLDYRATIYVNQNLRIPLPEEKPMTLAKADGKKSKVKKQTTSKTPTSKAAPPSGSPTLDRVLAKDGTAESAMESDTMIPDSSPLDKAGQKAEKQALPVLASVRSYEREDDRSDQLPQKASRESNANAETSPNLAGMRSNAANDSKSIAPRQAALTAEKNKSDTRPAIQAPEAHPEIIQGNLAVERVWKEQDRLIGIIRVEVEETLGHYAEWLGVSAWDLRRINGFSYGKVIRHNQRIKIPLHRVSKEEFEEKRFEYHQELSEDFFASYRVERVDIYHIKKGDNIWKLSWDKFEVPIWLIKRYNAHLNFDALVPAQAIRVPIIEKTG